VLDAPFAFQFHQCDEDLLVLLPVSDDISFGWEHATECAEMQEVVWELILCLGIVEILQELIIADFRVLSHHFGQLLDDIG